MRLLSLCSGIGCIDLAAEMAGMEIAGQVEYDPFCQQVLTKHWPNVRRLSDIKDVVGDEFGTIDVVAGGIPCQPFSRAGKRKGTEDDRHLWPYAFAIIKVAKPTWVLIENVAGFIELALDIIATDLEGEGYEVQAYVLPALAIGAPHQRMRCFIVAHANCQGSQTTWTEQQTVIPFQRRQDVAHASSAGWQERHATTITSDTGHITWRKIAPGNVENATGRREWQHNPTRTTQRAQHHAIQSGTGITQSRLGRVLDGATNWLDGHWRWPAPPGQEQEAWEPPRAVKAGQRVPNRGKRLKALGNAVVPQQIYPFFQYMIEAQAQAMKGRDQWTCKPSKPS